MLMARSSDAIGIEYDWCGSSMVGKSISNRVGDTRPMSSVVFVSFRLPVARSSMRHKKQILEL